MGKDIQTVQNYYADRMAAQYRGKPKASAEIQLLAGAATGDMFIQDVQDAFDVTTAVGPQLDILGKYIGLSRQVPETLSRPFFGFVEYDGSSTNTNGFQDYGSLPILGTWGSAIATSGIAAMASNPANLNQIVTACVGNPALIQYSTDGGLTWTVPTLPTGLQYWQKPNIAYGNGYWVVSGSDIATGGSLRIGWSTDMIHWSTATLGSVVNYGGMGAICFAADRNEFCIAASRASALMSFFTASNPSGAWVEHTTAFSDSCQYGGIVRGGGIYCAVTYSATYTSSDGTSWAVYNQSAIFTSGNGITYAENVAKFVVSAGSAPAYTSSDGITFASSGSLGSLSGSSGCCYRDGLTVVTGLSVSGGTGCDYAASNDCVHWITGTMPSGAWVVCPCAGGVIAGSDNGHDYVSICPLVYP
jgi:hypothetical protein